MKKLLFATLFPLLSLSGMATDFSVKTSQVTPQAWSATSVNTAVFRANSVTSRDTVQYVAYYDPEGYVTLASRHVDKDNWKVERSPYKGNVKDGHNIISIAVDSDGYIHAAFDHHGNKLHYCRSIAPGSLTLGPMESMTGQLEEDVTYPEFYTLAGGRLLFAYRSGASGRGNLVLNEYDTKSRTWKRLHDVLIDGENARNAYWQMHVDSRGTIHLSWVWRETWMVETNHDLCYARSTDGGHTWQRSDGTHYTLPITLSTAEVACYIPQKSELINQTSMSADTDGNPYIATYWRDSTSTIPQYRLVWHDGSTWHERQVSNRTTPFSLAGGGTKMIPIARPRMVTDGNRVFYITRDIERDSRVTVYHGTLSNPNWDVTDLTDYSVDAWEPSLDTDLWNTRRRLDIYVQHTAQGDGEHTTTLSPQPVNIISIVP